MLLREDGLCCHHAVVAMHGGFVFCLTRYCGYVTFFPED